MPFAALTEQQVQLHATNLANTANFRVFPILVETVLYAIFTILIITSSNILIGRGLQGRPAKIMLGVTLVMYGLSTYDWAVDIHLLRDDLKVFLPADLMQPPPDHARRIAVNAALHISQAITNNICTMLSDTVVCWRVYVVYGQRRSVLVVAAILLTLLFTGIITCNLTEIGKGFPSITNLHRLVPTQLQIDVVTLILSALVNIWATGMIGYKAWRCRQSIKRYLKDTSKRTFSESMLALFTETGVVYTTLWILKNIIVIPNVEPTSYTDYASMVMYQVTGMYPTLIIILIALRKSHLEYQFTVYGDGDSTVQNDEVVFASHPLSTTWNSARYSKQDGVLVSTVTYSSTHLGSTKEEDKASSVQASSIV
ncbi:hypothetical protein GGX14DRAFT_568281 [Mycena pura]|uniref:Uncharacterized protein n=1 Tax=Mycena pura TaxID=153505 RepID=A0AAD6Y910_9AGAR|nr:hypothetical protein GGX14DRAFT_568281 [Mycena pura]